MEMTYRGYRPGDEPLILELYNSAFSGRRTAAQWRWEYAHNPLGRYDIMLAFAGERLIAHAAGVPLVFRHGDQIVQASRHQHVAVHPNFQRRGIFTETFKRLTDELIRRGVDLAVTFPRDERHSLPGMMRSGYHTNVFDIRAWARPLQTPVPTPAGTRMEITDTISFRAEDVECAARFLERFVICNHRDLRYLNWRYSPASGKRYTVARVWRDGTQVGWVVAKPYLPGRSLDLVELFLPDEPALVAGTLGALAEHFRGQAVDRISLWSMDHYPLHACLLELGFTAEVRPTHTLVAPLSPRCSPHSVDPTAYYFAMGDSDVY